ncbi:MAG: nucleoside hydrolase [Firmicutes bacterium]|nr:nucleoside hydrolase [Bacillota bacterium]
MAGRAVPLILDMDPGVDDALALVTALRGGRVAGVSTVAGNAAAADTCRNARLVLARAGSPGLPVAAGAERPLFADPLPAEAVHGPHGLWQAEEAPGPLPAPWPEPAWRWLGRLLEGTEPVDLLATGPLTNLARVFLWFDGRPPALDTLVIMGGSLSAGNVTPTAEYNLYADPEAAEVVLAAAGRGRTRLVGLDVTRRVRFTRGDAARLAGLGGTLGPWLAEVVTAYVEAAARRHPQGPPGAAIHDVVALAALEQPELFEWEERPLGVVTTGPWRGSLLPLPPEAGRAPVAVARRVDVEGFGRWFWRRLGL